MNRNYIIVGYIPPPGQGGVNGQAFIRNIREWKTRNRMILFSDHDYPDVVKIHSPDFILQQTKNRWALNNAIFFTALKMAAENKATHVIYLEADCRVRGDFWDEVMTNEFEKSPDAMVGGSMVCFAPGSWDRQWAELYNQAIAINYGRKNFPIVAYNCGGSAERTKPSVFVNGALGIYDMRILSGAFGDLTAKDRVHKATRHSAWDWEIGEYLFEKYKHDAWKMVVHLGCVYSSYGNVLTQETDRMEMLDKGPYVAVHQVKGPWPGPLRKLDKDVKQDAPPNVAIFIVSYKNDAEWLHYCLKSIRKFATGFSDVIVCLPEHERKFWDANKWVNSLSTVYWFSEVEGYGHLSHVYMKCMADTVVHPDTEYVLHMDSDCIFTEPVTPMDYFVDGKPVLLKERYEAMENKNRYAWKEVTEKSLGFETPYETMCRHPSVYHVGLYGELRGHVESLHIQPLLDYILTTKFPGQRSGFCEFNALGGYALAKCQDKFHWVDVSGKPRPKNKLRQFFSLTGMDAPDAHNKDSNTPRQIIKALGL